MFLDRNVESSSEFLTIETESKHRISLTAFHLIGVFQSEGNFDFLPAKNVRRGNFLRVLDRNRTFLSPVVKIDVERKRGWFAPLSDDGTLFVNDVFVSSFALVRSHRAAQNFFFLFRLYSRVFTFFSANDPFHQDRPNLHWTIRHIFNFVRRSIFKLFFDPIFVSTQ